MMKKIHTHSHTGSCKDMYRHMCENLDNELDSAACREIRKHIEGCVNCSAMLDSLKKTVFLYKNYPVPEIPAAARQELFAVIQLEKEKTSRKK
jgi:hypothetical protein